MAQDLSFLDQRTRYVMLMTYADEQTIIDCLNDHIKSIRAYAWIAHDKDVDKNGELKETHIHVFIVLYDARTPQSVINWFTKVSNQNTFAEPMASNVRRCYEYLTHKNDKNKYQYSDDELHLHNVDYWMKTIEDDQDDDNIAMRIIEDLFVGTPHIEMVRRYGREFVINYDSYYNMAQRIRCNINPFQNDEQ